MDIASSLQLRIPNENLVFEYQKHDIARLSQIVDYIGAYWLLKDGKEGVRFSFGWSSENQKGFPDYADIIISLIKQISVKDCIALIRPTSSPLDNIHFKRIKAKASDFMPSQVWIVEMFKDFCRATKIK